MVADGKHRIALTRECGTDITCWEELYWPEDDDMDVLEHQLGAFMLSSLVRFTKAAKPGASMCVHFAIQVMTDEELADLEDAATHTSLMELVHAVERGEGG